MSTSETVNTAGEVSDVSSARRGHHDSDATRTVLSRRTVATDGSHLVPHLRAGLHLVDFGCGQGSLSLGLASLVAPGEVLGIDAAEASIAQARAQAELLGITNAVFRVADIHEAELPDASFDVAHFSGVLAYQADPLATLRMAHRALKPGGLIALREPQKEGDWVGGPFREVITLFNHLVIEDGFKSGAGDAFIGQRLGTLLGEAGFERVAVEPRYSAALSNVASIAMWALARLEDAAFTERVVRRGWITAEQLLEMPKAISVWRDSEASVMAIAECTALGWKAKPYRAGPEGAVVSSRA